MGRGRYDRTPACDRGHGGQAVAVAHTALCMYVACASRGKKSRWSHQLETKMITQNATLRQKHNVDKHAAEVSEPRAEQSDHKQQQDKRLGCRTVTRPRCIVN